MAQLNLIFHKIKSWFFKLDYICFGLSIFTLTLSIKLSSKFIFIALAVGLFKTLKKKNGDWFIKYKPLTYVYSIFIIYIFIHGIFLDGIGLFLKSFESFYAPYLILVLAPIFLKDPEKVRSIPTIIILGLFTTFFLIIFYSIIDSQIYDRVKVLEVFDIHHLYISLYILFSINHIFFSEIQGQLLSNKPLKILILIMLFLALIFFKSKSAIAIGGTLLLFFTIKTMKLKRYSLITIFIVILVTIISLRAYFYRAFIDALDFRSRIWKTSIELIIQKPIFGFGNAKEILVLNKQHFFNGDYDFLDSNLNTHNQILTFLLKFGLVGFVLMFYSWIYLIFNLKPKIKTEFIGFLYLLFLMMSIESVYNRHHGIVFITIVLYYYTSINSKSSPI